MVYNRLLVCIWCYSYISGMFWFALGVTVTVVR